MKRGEPIMSHLMLRLTSVFLLIFYVGGSFSTSFYRFTRTIVDSQTAVSFFGLSTLFLPILALLQLSRGVRSLTESRAIAVDVLFTICWSVTFWLLGLYGLFFYSHL